ncbi:MAG: hydrogenase [Planctomycetes bacterium]|nr:hydrogenase [Planctomycetota bacterium]
MTDLLLVAVVLTNFVLLGSSRLAACIRVAAAQGILVGVMPLILYHDAVSVRTALIAAAGITLKGIVFPWLFFRALRDVDVTREVEPFVGYTVSILIGVGAVAGSFWLGSRLVVPRPVPSAFVIPVAFSVIFIGLFLIVSRKTAISQALGYLVMENGIFAFGVSLALEEPFLVELGVLLDVFAATFLMGIMVFHISREFDHIDVGRLASLKDWTTRRYKS